MDSDLLPKAVTRTVITKSDNVYDRSLQMIVYSQSFRLTLFIVCQHQSSQSAGKLCC